MAGSFNCECSLGSKLDSTNTVCVGETSAEAWGEGGGGVQVGGVNDHTHLYVSPQKYKKEIRSNFKS